MLETKSELRTRTLHLPAVSTEGTLSLPDAARGVVLFTHGSGSSRFSPRNTYVASALQGAGLATFLFDFLTPAEAEDRARVFDIPLLSERLLLASEAVHQDREATGSHSASSGPAPGPPPLSSPPPRRPFPSPPWSLAAAGPISPARPSPKCGRRRCSSSAVSTARSCR